MPVAFLFTKVLHAMRVSYLPGTVGKYAEEAIPCHCS